MALPFCNVLTYSRVSTDDQAKGLSLPAQREPMRAECERRGWTITGEYADASSGKSLRRPELQIALTQLRLPSLTPTVLMVARLDRLSRSTLDFYDLLGRAEREGWQVVCLHPSVDMSDPMGRAMAGMAAVFAQLEREMISLRQRESVAARKAAGTYRRGHGTISAEALRRCQALRARGLSFRAIASRLALEGLQAPGGGVWHQATVNRALVRAQLEAPHDLDDDPDQQQRDQDVEQQADHAAETGERDHASIRNW